MNHSRLFIVANRLPICISGEKEKVTIAPTSGGLVSAVKSYLDASDHSFSEVYWAGVPGCSPTIWNEASNHIPDTSFTYLPVLVYKEQYDKYYNGFSNSVLWPLFHYFPSYAEYEEDEYEHYLAVNEHFSEILLKHCREGDTVWIHDYHLLPLAGILQKKQQGITIGFFLHIPFPSYELFRLLPKKWQEDLLKGMLGADLIGFHTMDYATHFMESVQKVLALDQDRNIIRFGDRLVKVDVFPISIDYQRFNEGYEKKEVASIRDSLHQKLHERKIIFSVDRLDYTKGVYNRLRGYELFLKQNPQYHNRVVFVMVVVPSRDTIPKYLERKRMIDELTSNINSKIGNLHWQPVVYQYNSLSFDEMVALYTACDLALITPLRDGMNLVAKEFVASRKDQSGVLIISEMAGAARELTDGLVINPNDIMEMAQQIKEGLEMKPEEQRRRMENMQQRIKSYDVNAWSNDFMTGLKAIKRKQQTFQEIFLDDFSKRSLYDAYRSAERRLLLLDYDGTLVPFSATPDLATPGPELLSLLTALSQKPHTDLYLISGRSSSWLDQYFGRLPINLIAEHGATCKLKGQDWVAEVPTHSEWKGQVYGIMEKFVRRCPQTFIEEKEFSVVWHYRNAAKEQGALKAMELKAELKESIHNRQLHIVAGSKIIEVKHGGIDKGTAIKKILLQNDYDFIFAVGDDKTDEDMFKTLVGREGCYSIKVGPNASYAQYNLLKPEMVISLMEGMQKLPIEARNIDLLRK